ncbi:beta/alpha barrel domain-containing protein [Robinsoniella peoriensis]
MGRIQLIDCTLRDGGQGLEDLNKNGFKTEVFTKEERIQIGKCLTEAGIDIVELGCMVESGNDTTGFAIYQNIEELSKYMPKKKKDNQLFVGLYIGPDTDIDRIPEHNPELIDGIRVILRYSELEKSLKYCANIAQKGYKTFVQPMLTMRYSDSELEYLLDEVNKMGAYAVYFVDSFGYMSTENVERLFNFYDKRLNPEIKIGFHAHNNMQMAFENVKYFLKKSNSNREIIIDSCAIGMGQGAGNMQTEIVVPYLNRKYQKEYSYKQILEVCEILGKFRLGELGTWGYSPVKAISAIHKAAYKYAVAMRVEKNMSLPEMNEVFTNMPEELKHRYTRENLEMVINISQKQ